MNWLNRQRVRTRLWVLCALALLGMALLQVVSLRGLHDSMLDERKGKIRTQVETAAGIITHYQALAGSGVLSDADARKAAVEALRGVRFDKTDYFFIFNTEHVYQLLPTVPEREGKYFGDMKDSSGKLFIRDLVSVARQGGGFVDYEFPRGANLPPEPKLSYTHLVPGWDWVVGTGVYIDDIDRAFRDAALASLGTLALLAAGILALAWMVTRSIVRQLGGEPAQGIQAMEKVARGDLRVEIGNAPPGSMLAALGNMARSLREVMRDIAGDATALNAQAESVASASHQISGAASRQSDATAAMAAAMEELTVSINHISDGAATTEQASRQAAELSHNGVSQIGEAKAAIQAIHGSVTQTSEKVRSLDNAAGEISGIAAVIKEIAGQTNLLALNAAIEAARAGEQGRGFAVVADEVRKLAERTASATVNIEQMLASVQSETREVVTVMEQTVPQVARGVGITQEIAELLGHINTGTGNILANLAEIASATREQSTASTSIATQVEQVSQMAEETTQSVHHAEQSAEQIAQVSRRLRDIVGKFQI